jgi:hypothetical protein
MSQNDRKSLSSVEVRNAAPQRKSVTISRADLDWASSQGLVGTDQVGKLWQALVERSAATNTGGLNLINLAYYGGATIVLIAMALFMGLVTAQYQAPALVGTSLVYGAAFVALGSHLFFRKGLEVPGGLMFTLAVAITPVFVFALMNMNGAAPPSTSQELILEVVTVVASVVALTFVRFPFLTMPLFTALWLMSVTITSMVSHGQSWFWGDEQLIVSMVFGALMTLGSVVIDRRTEKDFAFWGYLFGVSSFWLALTFFDKGGQLGMLGYFAVNILLLLASVVLQRRIFLAAGGLGATGYLMYLSWDIFKDSMMAFAVVLSGIGVGVIFLGIQYHKNKAAIDAAILRLLPAGLRSLPNRQG